MLEGVRQKIPREMSIYFGITLGIFFVLVGVFCTVGRAAENSSEADDLADIDSGFFISRNEVYGLPDQAFKEKLLIFITEKGILTKSSRGLIYYYISDDAIAQIEDSEFKAQIMEFVSEPLERRLHIVQSGDSLWEIAAKYGISVQELVHLNNMTSTEPIYPGQKLKVAPDGD